jgi:hypothetical protein
MSIFAAAAAILAADPHLGVAATYTPAGGQPVQIRVVASRPEDPIGGLDGPRSLAIAAAIMVAAGALPAPPARGDAVTFNATAYLVAEVIQDEAAASFTLHLRRAPPPPPSP